MGKYKPIHIYHNALNRAEKNTILPVMTPQKAILKIDQQIINNL